MNLTQTEIKKFTDIVNKMDSQDSQLLIQIWKNAQNMKSANKAAEFRKGNNVQFKNKYGEKIVGVVTKVNRKTIAVSTSEGNWKVSPNLLSLAS